MISALTTVPAFGTPLPPMGNFSTIVLVATLGCALAAIGFVVAVIVLSRPQSHGGDHFTRESHRALTDKEIWHTRIDDIVGQHERGEIDSDEAFTRLAELTREFASTGFNRNMSNHTLTDFKREPRIPSNQQSLDLLRQTIAALYPPEFADAEYNEQARETTVEEASTWVATLVERWQ